MENNITNREPDFESDKIRGWNASKDSAKEFEQTKGIEISLNKDEQIKLVGFSGAYDKTDNHLVFAFKVVPNKRMVLYYVADETQTIKVVRALNELKHILNKKMAEEILLDASNELGVPLEELRARMPPPPSFFELNDIRSSFLDAKKFAMSSEAKVKASDAAAKGSKDTGEGKGTFGSDPRDSELPANAAPEQPKE